MKFFLFVLCFLGFQAHSMNGVLEVKSGSLRVQRDDGFKVRFYVGQFPTELNIDVRNLYLGVTRKDIKTDVTVNLPPDFRLPENGEFEIEGTKLGQTFDIEGTNTTETLNSQNYSEFETCTYMRQVWVCRNHGYHQYCRWEDELAQGYKPVDFYIQSKTTVLKLNLNSNNSGEAEFNGTSVDRKKIYTFQGNCH